MYQTRTGNFPIGFRRGWSDWQKDLPTVTTWAKENGFSVIDLGNKLDDIKSVQETGLKIGSVDLKGWGGLLSADPGKRAEAIAINAEYIAAAGAQNYFCVMVPEDPKKTRLENFGYMVEGLGGIAPELEKAGGKLVIEGWPGPGALCCTPESYRATFKEVGSDSIGINYDPSHLQRMGIDPIRFLKEFKDRVFHCHGKDAALLADDIYEYGFEQPATFKKSPDFGSAAWRYTIPGHGNTNWNEVLRILTENGYQGAVSIELEDENYNGSEEGEKLGLITSAQFLASS
jgi:sugar phosphate isomerase/epimerase